MGMEGVSKKKEKAVTQGDYDELKAFIGATAIVGTLGSGMIAAELTHEKHVASENKKYEDAFAQADALKLPHGAIVNKDAMHTVDKDGHSAVGFCVACNGPHINLDGEVSLFGIGGVGF